MPVKTLTDALVEAHLSLIYSRAGLAIATANGEATLDQHQAAIDANAARLVAIAAQPGMTPPPLNLADLVNAEVDLVLDNAQQVIDKYTTIRDNPVLGELLYAGTEYFDNPQYMIDVQTRYRDTIDTARDAHVNAGLPIPELP